MALMLNSMEKVGMDILKHGTPWQIGCTTWDASDHHSTEKENIVTTRHSSLSLEKRLGETTDGFIERIERVS